MIELLADAVAQDPSKAESWAIYADYLLGVEPLVGERIALGLGLVAATSEQLRTELRGQIVEHERRYPEALLGVALASSLQELEAAELVQLERRFGMVVGASVRDRKGEAVELDSVFRALLACPAARVLAELAIDVLDGRSFATLVGSLAQQEDLVLRRLLLGAGERGGWYAPERLPDLQAALDRLPRLERLSLHAPFVTGATHPSLRKLELGPCGVSKWSLRGWCVPALETLHVHGLGDSAWPELPKLRRLLVKASDSDALVASLVDQPWLGQLDSLILLGKAFTDAGIATMLTHAGPFATIARIDMIGVLGLTTRRARAPLLDALPNIAIASSDWLERRAITKFE